MLVTVFLTVGTLQAMGWLKYDADEVVSSWKDTAQAQVEEVLENVEEKWEKIQNVFQEVNR